MPFSGSRDQIVAEAPTTATRANSHERVWSGDLHCNMNSDTNEGNNTQHFDRLSQRPQSQSGLQHPVSVQQTPTPSELCVSLGGDFIDDFG